MEQESVAKRLCRVKTWQEHCALQIQFKFKLKVAPFPYLIWGVVFTFSLFLAFYSSCCNNFARSLVPDTNPLPSSHSLTGLNMSWYTISMAHTLSVAAASFAKSSNKPDAVRTELGGRLEKAAKKVQVFDELNGNQTTESL